MVWSTGLVVSLCVFFCSIYLEPFLLLFNNKRFLYVIEVSVRSFQMFVLINLSHYSKDLCSNCMFWITYTRYYLIFSITWEVLSLLLIFDRVLFYFILLYHNRVWLPYLVSWVYIIDFYTLGIHYLLYSIQSPLFVSKSFVTFLFTERYMPF